MEKYLIDKDIVRKINMDVIPSIKTKHNYVYVEKGVHDERVKGMFKTWYGREYCEYVTKEIEHEAGWYHKWNYIRYDEKVDVDYVCEEKKQFIKDNILYCKDKLIVKITDVDNNKETYYFYFDSVEDAKNKMEAIVNKFKTLVVL